MDDDALSSGDRRVGATKPPHVYVAVVVLLLQQPQQLLNIMPVAVAELQQMLQKTQQFL